MFVDYVEKHMRPSTLGAHHRIVIDSAESPVTAVQKVAREINQTQSQRS